MVIELVFDDVDIVEVGTGVCEGVLAVLVELVSSVEVVEDDEVVEIIEVLDAVHDAQDAMRMHVAWSLAPSHCDAVETHELAEGVSMLVLTTVCWVAALLDVVLVDCTEVVWTFVVIVAEVEVSVVVGISVV